MCPYKSVSDSKPLKRLMSAGCVQNMGQSCVTRSSTAPCCEMVAGKYTSRTYLHIVSQSYASQGVAPGNLQCARLHAHACLLQGRKICHKGSHTWCVTKPSDAVAAPAAAEVEACKLSRLIGGVSAWSRHSSRMLWPRMDMPSATARLVLPANAGRAQRFGMLSNCWPMGAATTERLQRYDCTGYRGAQATEVNSTSASCEPIPTPVQKKGKFLSCFLACRRAMSDLGCF